MDDTVSADHPDVGNVDDVADPPTEAVGAIPGTNGHVDGLEDYDLEAYEEAFLRDDPTDDDYDEYEDDFDASLYEDEPFLFEGDPDDYEMGFGLPPAQPTPGDLLVIDEPDYWAPPPRRTPPRMSRAERRRRVRLQARRVRRIVRHVEPWSVLKISLLFYACLWVIFLVAGFMIWGVAESSGTVGKIESLVRDLFALDTFSFDAGQIFRGYAFGGLALAIAGTTFNVLMCLLFNLISDLTGGLRITMIEEETARPMPPRRRRRRPRPQQRPRR